MSEFAKTDTGASAERSYLRSHWLNHRRKRFWAIAAVILYTLAGFFLVPVLVEHFTVKTIKETTGRDAQIAEVRFNPYVLSLRANGFDFRDTDGESLASFDELYVNFQVSSLFRWAITLHRHDHQTCLLADTLL